MQQPDSPKGKPIHERFLLLVMAAIQFTTILDFLIIMPLGPQYMRVFGITTDQFGIIVSAYAISAGISGVASSFFLDRFDRKKALLGLYTGFTIGTLFCALAPTYPLLVAARAFAGAFGGISGALILAIIGDVIPEGRRGAAMGMMMSSFSVASICGVPLGLFLAAHFSWHIPFFALAALSAAILIAAFYALPSLRGHMHHARDQHPAARMLAILMHKDHQMAFVLMAGLSFTGFSIFPYLSNYMVANVGLTEEQLPLIYVTGGVCTLFSLNWIGRWADRVGKFRVFVITSLVATIPILVLTNLPHVSLTIALCVSSIFMICMSGRMVPAMAMMTGSIEPRYRGGFMSINSSVQQFTAGLAAYVGGHILKQTPKGQIANFPTVGWIGIACALACIYWAKFLKVPTQGTTDVPIIFEA